VFAYDSQDFSNRHTTGVRSWSPPLIGVSRYYGCTASIARPVRSAFTRTRCAESAWRFCGGAHV